METKNMNALIDDFNSLPIEDQEFAVELIKKTFSEAKREVILSNSKTAEEDLQKGIVKRGTAQDLRNDLEND